MLDTPLKRTPIHAWHVKHGGQMVPFAGYELPVQYAPGILREHLHVRASVGLFDVSHMGIALLSSRDGMFEPVASALETLVPADIAGLAAGQQRYTQLLNVKGGILDDLMVWRPWVASDTLGIVVNAACKEADYAHLQANLPPSIKLTRRDELALFALQGPDAEAVLSAGAPGVSKLNFMQTMTATCFGISVHVARSGYTGEDGFEISVANDRALDLWSLLVKDLRVLPIGLGARELFAARRWHVPLRQRHRSSHITNRSKFDLVHSEAPTEQRGLSRCRPYLARNAKWGEPSSRRLEAGRAGAGSGGCEAL